MRIIFSILFVLIMIPITIASFAEELKIEFGETVSYENLKLYFYDIEDSRCTSDVTCVWEGKVAAMIHISNHTHKIGGPIEIGHPMTYISPYTVTVVDVKPYPISIEKPDYVATLEITKLNSSTEPPVFDRRTPLKQFKSGVSYNEIKCKGNLQLTQRYDGAPACVKDGTIFELIKRGWTNDVIRLVQSRDVFLYPKDATSSYMEKITPTLDDFKNTLSKSQNIDVIFSEFGKPLDDIGSGIHIYVYELNDFTKIWIGYVDDIWYVKHVDVNGNVLEDMFVKNEN